MTQDAETGDRSLRQRLADAQDRVRPWSAWTLRAKLVASMLALFTVLSLATGAFTVIALDRQLTGQVDDQLRTSIAQLVNWASRFDFGYASGRRRPPRPRRRRSHRLLPTTPTAHVQCAAGTRDAGRPARCRSRRPAGGLRAPVSWPSRDRVALRPRPLSARAGGRGPVNPQTRDRTSVCSCRPARRRRPHAPSADGGPRAHDGRRRHHPRRRCSAPGSCAATSSRCVGVAATATKVSRMPLDSGQVALAERVDAADTDTRTEVGQVGAAFNEMLDHVDEALNARHQSEQRVRQFVADASHELRTPLASIKGYAELSRREPDAVPPTVTHAMGRIESEANRMSSLVEDLLLLARLDAGRPLEEAPVDVSMLVINAVSDAHAASPGHRWDLDLPPEPVEVHGRQRPAAPGRRQPARQRAHPHPGRHPGHDLGAAGGRVGAGRGPRRRARACRIVAAQRVRAFRPRRRRARAGRWQHRVWACRSSPR